MQFVVGAQPLWVALAVPAGWLFALCQMLGTGMGIGLGTGAVTVEKFVLPIALLRFVFPAAQFVLIVVIMHWRSLVQLIAQQILILRMRC